MDSTGNQHCANCIGTLSFPIGQVVNSDGGAAGVRRSADPQC